MIEDARGVGALRAAATLTRGHWWRTFGIVVLANLVALAARAADRIAVRGARRVRRPRGRSLVGQILAEALTAPFVALVATLLFYDLRARRPEPV